MKFSFKILIPLIFFSAYSLFSQGLRFRHIGVEDGLSQNTINCLYQDRYGFIWIGTEDGLNRYDGYNFKVFIHNPADSASLSHSWIWDIKEDKDGNLWLATWHGLNRYDRKNNRFIRYLFESTDDNTLNGERPSSICVDSSGVLWVATWGNGIKYYLPQENRFVALQGITLPSNFVRRLYTDHNGTLWIGTWDGLLSVKFGGQHKPQTALYQHKKDDKSSLSSNRILSIYEDKSGHLWVGTFGGGLNRFLPKSRKFKHYRHNPKNPNSLSNNQISFIIEDRKERLWVGTISGGLNRLIKDSEKFEHFRHETDNPASLKNDKLYCVLKDRSDMLWIGGEGLNLLSNKLNRFTLFRHDPHKSNALSHNKVWSFCEDGRGGLWLGTDGGGLNYYNRKTGHFKAYKYNPTGHNNLNSSDIRALACWDNKLWIGTNGGGLNIFNQEDKTFEHFKDNPAIPQTKGINYILALAFDKNNNLWIGTYENGLIVYDLKQRIFKKFEAAPLKEKKLTGNYISALLCDSKGDMWVGGWGGGLCRFNEKDNTFTRFLHETDNPKSLISNIVHTIHESVQDGKRILWVGTNSGVSYMDPDAPGKGFRHIGNGTVLGNNVIYGILDDDDGRIWFSSNLGIFRYNPENMRIRRFTYHDGLQSNEFNAGAALKCKDGLLLFGGINGFNSFYPRDIKESDYRPPLILTSFKILDKPWNSGLPLLDISQIRLKYKQNFFSFEFSALDYNEPQANLYKYKMEGFDKNWIESGTRRYISYTNLDPGSYTLKIAGSNSDGIWAGSELSLGIIITPPYWATWWFRLLIFLSVFALFYLFHKIRVARLLEIERLRTQIASDLHDDIGSSLTKIAINSEIIQNTKDRGSITSAARSIGQVSRAVIITMSDIIWSIDARNDTIGDLLDRMKDTAVDLFSESDTQYRFKHSGLDQQRKIAIQLRQNIFLIYKEALNNIVRHSQADEVLIELYNKGGDFIMKISDNGRGLDLQAVKAGNGIKNMKMRAQRIGARFEMTNKKGLTIFLQMKSL